jgi:hypothetical protein
LEEENARKKQILLTKDAVGVKLDEMVVEENKKQEQIDNEINALQAGIDKTVKAQEALRTKNLVS